MKFYYVEGCLTADSEYVWHTNSKDQYAFSIHCTDGFDEIKSFTDNVIAGKEFLKEPERLIKGEDPGECFNEMEQQYWEARRAGGGREPFYSQNSGKYEVRRPINIAYSDFRQTVYFRGLDAPVVDKVFPRNCFMDGQFVRVKCRPVQIGQSGSIGFAAEYIDPTENGFNQDLLL